MANINTKNDKKNMYSHTQITSFNLIDKYLQKNYISDAVLKCTELNIETTVDNIRQIKNKRGTKNIYYLKILKVLVEIALENKNDLKKLEQKLIDN